MCIIICSLLLMFHALNFNKIWEQIKKTQADNDYEKKFENKASKYIVAAWKIRYYVELWRHNATKSSFALTRDKWTKKVNILAQQQTRIMQVENQYLNRLIFKDALKIYFPDVYILGNREIPNT